MKFKNFNSQTKASFIPFGYKNEIAYSKTPHSSPRLTSTGLEGNFMQNFTKARIKLTLSPQQGIVSHVQQGLQKQGLELRSKSDLSYEVIYLLPHLDFRFRFW